MGGAAANLFAARFGLDSIQLDLKNVIRTSDVYAFTFGALNSINTVPRNNHGFRYINNIFNHYDDFGNSYGAGKPLKGKITAEKFGTMQYFSHDYPLDYPGDHTFHFDNHVMPGYIMAIKSGETGALSSRYTRYGIQCPVDVEIFDADGRLMGSIKNNVVDDGAKTFDAYVVGDEKYLLMPSNEAYIIRLTGTDEGIMYMTAQSFVSDEDFIEEKCFANVELSVGKTMFSQVGGETTISDTQLFVLDSQDIPTAEIQVDGTEISLETTPTKPPSKDDSKPSVPHIARPPVTDAPTNPAPDYINPFADVSENDWFYDDVVFAYANNLIKGTSDVTFSPNEPMTRAMFITVLWRICGEPEALGKSNPFSDVSENLWYTDAIIWAASENIVSGYGNGYFGPTDIMTREQMVLTLYNYAKFKKQNISLTNDLATYSDANQISGWALTAIQWAVAEEIIRGRTLTTIVPKGIVTRAEATKLLVNYIKV